jgi:hypothetical protein
MATKQNPPRLAKRGVWNEYADGEWWKLVRGEDWHGTESYSRASTARYWAQTNGYRLENRTDGPDVLYVRFTPKTKND